MIFEFSYSIYVADSHTVVYTQVVTDSIESECEICVGQSFGPRETMVDFGEGCESKGQIQPFKGGKEL